MGAGGKDQGGVEIIFGWGCTSACHSMNLKKIKSFSMCSAERNIMEKCVFWMKAMFPGAAVNLILVKF